MNKAVELETKSRGIRRLCHFTPSRNLQHIAAGRTGLLSTASLEADERKAFSPTDLQRLDQRKTHICCSIEFPNAWYFARAREQDRLFLDWVVLLIAPHYLWGDDTLYCPRNAAAGLGRHVVTGLQGFNSMFATSVVGAGQTFTRTSRQRAATPTDQQAEVLVPDSIPTRDIMAIAVRTAEQARTERTRLRINGVDPDLFTFVVAPHFYDKYRLSTIIRTGDLPLEPPYKPGNPNDG